MSYALGYSMTPVYNWDGLAWTYLSIAIVWTILLAAGIVFLVLNRKLPYLRIRDIPLSVSAVITLHVYWCLCMVAYILNGNFPCGTEYWIMSIYLPLGIALYQASNTQLLQIASQQKKFVYDDLVDLDGDIDTGRSRGLRKAILKWTALTKTKKTMACITVGISVQVSCILIHHLKRL